MRLTVSNRTQDSLLCWFRGRTADAFEQPPILVSPHSESVQFSPKCRSLLFSRLDTSFKTLPDFASSAAIKLPVAPGRRWQRVTVQGGNLPLIIYRNRISRGHHVLVVFPYRNVSCFLANIPDAVPLSSLMLPGTHETMAFYGWPVSQCQTRPLEAQLLAGIRVIDIRLSIIEGRLIAYHGIFPQATPFAEMLITLFSFLTCPATLSETVVVSIKQEDSDTTSFPKLVRKEMVMSPGGLGMWHLENRIPTLGEVRGKAVLFSRFGSDDANGVHPPVWPDSAKEGFQWECGHTLVRTQDWYNIPSFLSISEKTSLSTEILVSAPETPIPVLSVSFMSASSIPLALPPIIACGFGWPKWGLGFEGVNDRVGRWLLDKLRCGDGEDAHSAKGSSCTLTNDVPWHTEAGPRIRGWVLMDYYADPIDAEVVRLFVECNFRGRRVGEEGW